jgi:3D (Asp-Asp-Asp) domain-containing protein
LKVKLLFVTFVVLAVLYLAIGVTSSLAEEIHIPDTATAEAYRKSQAEMHSMIATAYCLNGTTATGTQTRVGIAASKREWFGKTVRVYWNDGGQAGSLIGEYVIEDTGGRPIRNGSVIDIWMPTKDECLQFGRRCVLVEVVD